jgi:hypothetical protein
MVDDEPEALSYKQLVSKTPTHSPEKEKEKETGSTRSV